mgnify:FL=1
MQMSNDLARLITEASAPNFLDGVCCGLILAILAGGMGWAAWWLVH